ncbi:hypothetical protein G3573_20165, partial [Caulobacter sp. 17J65-9]|nr:hypothetical protein [Caulobacter sp. 17J65-9]
MQKENARNTIIFIVCTLAILLLYQHFVLQPQAERRQAAAKAAAAAVQTAPAAGPTG